MKPIQVKPTHTLTIPSPIGDLYCAATNGAITHILYTPDGLPDVPYGSNPILDVLQNMFEEYFAGRRKQFDIPNELYGTAHQLAVWAILEGIPYGQTVSYAQIAAQIGSSPVAVGQAVGKNRINILVPCHRVVGSDGSLTGYGGGLKRKRFLLKLEGAIR